MVIQREFESITHVGCAVGVDNQIIIRAREIKARTQKKQTKPIHKTAMRGIAFYRNHQQLTGAAPTNFRPKPQPPPNSMNADQKTRPTQQRRNHNRSACATSVRRYAERQKVKGRNPIRNQKQQTPQDRHHKLRARKLLHNNSSTNQNGLQQKSGTNDKKEKHTWYPAIKR